MNRIPRSRSLLALVPAVAAFLVMQACGGSDDAVAQEVIADPIEGVWEGPSPSVTLGGTTATPVNSSQFFDLNGTLLRSACGTDTGTRVL